MNRLYRIMTTVEECFSRAGQTVMLSAATKVIVYKLHVNMTQKVYKPEGFFSSSWIDNLHGVDESRFSWWNFVSSCF